MSKKVSKDDVLEVIAKLMNLENDELADLESSLLAGVSRNLLDKKSADDIMAQAVLRLKVKIDLLDIIYAEIRIM